MRILNLFSFSKPSGRGTFRLFVSIFCTFISLATSSFATAQNVGTIESQSNPSDDEKKWSVGANYLIMSDIQDSRKPRLYYHKSDLKTGYEFTKNTVFTTALTAKWTSLENKIPEDRSQSHPIPLRLRMGPTYSLGKIEFINSDLGAGSMVDIPLDKIASYQGRRASFRQKFNISTPILTTGLCIVNEIEYSYNWNAYFESGSSPGSLANIQDQVGYQLGAVYSLTDNLKVFAGYDQVWVQHLDGFTRTLYGNTQTISYSFNRNFSTAISHHNGSFPDDGVVEIWFYNRFQRIVSASLSIKY